MTQVLFDLAYLEAFLARLGGPCPIPLLIGIFYVRSYQLALRLHNEVPGSSSRGRCRRGCATPDQCGARPAWRSHASSSTPRERSQRART